MVSRLKPAVYDDKRDHTGKRTHFREDADRYVEESDHEPSEEQSKDESEAIMEPSDHLDFSDKEQKKDQYEIESDSIYE